METQSASSASVIQFFKFVPKAVLSAPRVEEAFNSERTVRPETAHLFASPIRVKMRTKGRGWTDFLNPITSHAPVLCSQRVFNVIHQEKLQGIELIPVTLKHEKKSTVLSPPCNFYWLIPTGKVLGCLIKAYALENKNYVHLFTTDNPSDGRLSRGASTLVCRSIPIYDQWDGSDIIKFREDQFAGGGMMYCSRRFVEIAYRQKWSNLWVTPFDCIQGYFEDLRDLPWPPELWYPPNEPRD